MRKKINHLTTRIDGINKEKKQYEKIFYEFSEKGWSIALVQRQKENNTGEINIIAKKW